MRHSIRQSNEKSLVQFDYIKAVSNYFGTQSTFNPLPLALGGTPRLAASAKDDFSGKSHEQVLVSLLNILNG